MRNYDLAILTATLALALCGCGDPNWWLEANWNQEEFVLREATAMANLSGAGTTQEASATPATAPRPSQTTQLPEADSASVATSNACSLADDSPFNSADPINWNLTLGNGYGPLTLTISRGEVVRLTDALGESRMVIRGGSICESPAGATTTITVDAVLDKSSPTFAAYTLALSLTPQAGGSSAGNVTITHLGESIITSVTLVLENADAGSSGGGGGGYSYSYVVYY